MTTDLTDTPAHRRARALALYREGGISVARILAACRIDRQSFYDALHREGLTLRGHVWLRRTVAPPVPGAPRIEPPWNPPGAEMGAPPVPAAVVGEASPGRPAPETGPVDLAELSGRMARLVAQNMTVLEGSLAPGHGADPERIGRALTTQARMLAGLEKSQKGREEDAGADRSDPPPRSLAELRDELRRHLERIDHEGRPGGLPPDADPGGNAEPPGALADLLPEGPASAE